MKVAILGGGFSGLAAAYYLSKKGYGVTLFEKDQALGGLASGFKEEGWDWYLERAYHHLFSNDTDILNFARDIGFDGIFFRSPETASLYKVGKIDSVPRFLPQVLSSLRACGEPSTRDTYFSILPMDTPQDFLKFPLLSFPIKIRAAMVLAFLKFSPFLSLYERQTAEQFLKKTMGEEAWNVLWRELFRKKFGKYAGNIVASFFWARITKRTKNLGYVRGGFQELINHTEESIQKAGVEVKKGFEIKGIGVHGSRFTVHGTDTHEEFDAVISTLPTPILIKLGSEVLPKEYLENLSKIKYLHAINLILETKEPLLDKTYWLSICEEKFPFMVAVQHTNFMDKKHYGGNHLLYLGNYVDGDDRRLKMTKEEILKYYSPFLRQINSEFSILNSKSYFFKAPFAQPIFDEALVKFKPDFETPVKNFFIANLDMTYPYDRGTNYAVKLGKEVSTHLF